MHDTCALHLRRAEEDRREAAETTFEVDDFDDEDEGKSKSKKKRRKIESTEEEFISPEDLIEKRRSGRSSRGAPKNYDDNAVPNFSDGDADSDDDEPARARQERATL